MDGSKEEAFATLSRRVLLTGLEVYVTLEPDAMQTYGSYTVELCGYTRLKSALALSAVSSNSMSYRGLIIDIKVFER